MAKPVVIGIDSATVCGCAVGRIGAKPALTSVRLGRANDELVLLFGAAASMMHRLIDEFDPVLIAVEQPFFKEGETNYGATAKLHGIYGSITGAAVSRGVQVWPVAVQTWRSVTLGAAQWGGRDNAKTAMLNYCKAIGWDAPDDNAADAGGVWNWAVNAYAPYGVVPA